MANRIIFKLVTNNDFLSFAIFALQFCYKILMFHKSLSKSFTPILIYLKVYNGVQNMTTYTALLNIKVRKRHNERTLKK